MPFYGGSSLSSLSSLRQLFLNYSLEVRSLRFICEIKSNLTVFSFESVKIRPWCFVSKLVVDLLIENHYSSVHVKHSDKVGASRVVFDETDDTTGSFVPSYMTRTLRLVDLNDGRSQRWTSQSQKLPNNMVLFVGQQS